MAFSDSFTYIIKGNLTLPSKPEFLSHWNKTIIYIEDIDNIHYSYHTGYMHSLIRVIAVQSLNS